MWIRPASISRTNGAQLKAGGGEGPVKTTMGHSGPRTAEKWRINGTRVSSGRVSMIVATLLPLMILPNG